MGLIRNRSPDQNDDEQSSDEDQEYQTPAELERETGNSQLGDTKYDTPAELENQTGDSSLGAHPEKTPSEIAEM